MSHQINFMIFDVRNTFIESFQEEIETKYEFTIFGNKKGSIFESDHIFCHERAIKRCIDHFSMIFQHIFYGQKSWFWRTFRRIWRGMHVFRAFLSLQTIKISCFWQSEAWWTIIFCKENLLGIWIIEKKLLWFVSFTVAFPWVPWRLSDAKSILVAITWEKYCPQHNFAHF